MTNIVDRNEKEIQIPPPINGMNSTDPPHKLKPLQGVDAWNVEIDEVIGINKRSGMTLFNTASAIIPKYSAGTIASITGVMVYGSGTNWTNVVTQSDVFFMVGNSSPYYWLIDNIVGSQTISLVLPYTQTITASSYSIGVSSVQSLFKYKKGTTQKLLAFGGKDGYDGGSGITGSFTAIGANLTNNAPVSGVTFQDKFFFCNGYEFKSWDQTTVSTVGGSPNPSDPLYVGLYTIGNANWLVIAGSNTDATKSAFAFSDINAPATWPAANVYYAGDRDGTVLTGSKPIPGGWAIYKENSIYVFSGIPGSGTLRKISSVGCVAPKTLIDYEGVNYFVGKRSGILGVYAFDGNSIYCLSNCIEPTLKALKTANLSKMSAEIINNKYYLSGTSANGGFNDRHFVCYIKRPFSTEFRMEPDYPWIRGNRGYGSLLDYDVAGTSYLLSGSPTNGFVYIENNGTKDDVTDNLFGNTAAINSYVDTSWMDFGDNSRKKEWLRAFIDANQSGQWNLNLFLYKDFQTYGYDTYLINLGSTVMEWADIVYLSTKWQTAVDKQVQKIEFNYPNFATYFKLRWTNSTLDQFFSVYPLMAYYKLEQSS